MIHYRCNHGHVFEADEAKRRHYIGGETEVFCPVCDSDDLEEVFQCCDCGGWFPEDELSGMYSDQLRCDDCLRKKATLENALAIMGARGMKTAIVCTNDYHLTRALWLARDVGLPASGLPAQSTRDIVSFVRGRLRETCSWILYFARKHLFSGMR